MHHRSWMRSGPRAPAVRHRRSYSEEHIGGEEVRPLDAKDGIAEIAQLVLALPLEFESNFRVVVVDVVLARSIELGDDFAGLIGEVSARDEVPRSSRMVTCGSNPEIECSTNLTAQIDSPMDSRRSSILSITAAILR